jgi:hypothetical protein
MASSSAHKDDLDSTSAPPIRDSCSVFEKIQGDLRQNKLRLELKTSNGYGSTPDIGTRLYNHAKRL